MAPLGIVLAAGAGRRYGGPKALVRDETGRTWLERACGVLIDGGCGEVLATVPAGAQLAAPSATTLLPLVTDGLAASLRAALDAAGGRGAQVPDVPDVPDVIVVLLVDLPDVTAEVVRRVLDHAAPLGRASLARAVYAGRPGHPVVIGADHLPALREQLAGDTGANAYLAARGAAAVECGDLATGRDVDRR